MMNRLLSPYGFVIILFMILISRGKAQNNTIFEVNASALLNDKPATEYSLMVYLDGNLKDSVFCKKTKPTRLVLESSKIYSILLKKDGYPEKLVIINTYVPAGIRELNDEPFELQVELTSVNGKKDLEGYPVAILMVSKKSKSLMASESYHQLTH